MISKVDPELVFELIQDEFGRLFARCLNAKISVEGSDLEELHDNVSAALSNYFPDSGAPAADSVHFVMYR